MDGQVQKYATDIFTSFINQMRTKAKFEAQNVLLGKFSGPGRKILSPILATAIPNEWPKCWAHALSILWSVNSKLLFLLELHLRTHFIFCIVLYCSSANGIWSQVETGTAASLQEQISQYYEYYSTLHKGPSEIIWTEPYLDAFGADMVVTSAKAVYDRSNTSLNKLVAVVSIDISYEYIQKVIFIVHYWGSWWTRHDNPIRFTYCFSLHFIILNSKRNVVWIQDIKMAVYIPDALKTIQVAFHPL